MRKKEEKNPPRSLRAESSQGKVGIFHYAQRRRRRLQCRIEGGRRERVREGEGDAHPHSRSIHAAFACLPASLPASACIIVYWTRVT